MGDNSPTILTTWKKNHHKSLFHKRKNIATRLPSWSKVNIISNIAIFFCKSYWIKSEIQRNTVKPVYKGHSREPENVPFIIIWTVHQWEMWLSFIDSDLLYRGAL
jgi:hypothetical protein